MSSELARKTAVIPPLSGTVESFDTTRIYYDLYDLDSPSLVLVVPGFWRHRRHPALVRLAGFLGACGHRVAVCDLRGHGDSGGTFGFNLHEHYDVAAVAEELLRKLPVESVTLMGFSYGGAVAISTAARHPLPLAGLLLVSPVADFARIVPRLNPFTMHRHIAFANAFRRPRFDWSFGRSAKIRALDDISAVHAPLCLIHVKNDWLIDHSHSVALYEQANEPKELHIIDMPGNYHADRIFSVASETIEPMIRDFLARL
ncbi:MAG: alpha/beta hydrolase fold family protein [Acidobacteria bacterium]|nr:alpha/beta hydrolase fold family protein [Acidobacteriota bacterium]